MKITKCKIEGVYIIEPKVFKDKRGLFLETFRVSQYSSEVGISDTFVQDSISRSTKGVLRGMHFQKNNPQGKLVHVLKGEVFDVVVDIRRDSKTFGHHQRVILEPSSLVWIPSGFAHGFQALSDDTIMLYQCTGPYSPESERCINVFDKRLNIVWEDTKDAIISQKDLMGIDFKNADYF